MKPMLMFLSTAKRTKSTKPSWNFPCCEPKYQDLDRGIEVAIKRRRQIQKLGRVEHRRSTQDLL
jgi:hypothetical protein